MAEGYVLGIGAAEYGRTRQEPRTHRHAGFKPRPSAHLGGRSHAERAGKNLSRLGVKDQLVSAVGADLLTARWSCAARRRAGIDISGVVTIPGRPRAAISPSWTRRRYARRHVGHGHTETSPELVRSLGGSCAALPPWSVTPCLPDETVAAIIREAGEVPGSGPDQHEYARKGRQLAGGQYCVKPNRIELGVLADSDTDTAEDIERLRRLLSKGTRRVAVGLGERGCYYADAEGRRLLLRPCTPLSSWLTPTARETPSWPGWSTAA